MGTTVLGVCTLCLGCTCHELNLCRSTQEQTCIRSAAYSRRCAWERSEPWCRKAEPSAAGVAGWAAVHGSVCSQGYKPHRSWSLQL